MTVTVVIEIPVELYNIISDIAKKRGKSVEQIILESFINSVDPKRRIELYLQLHETFLKEFEKFYNKGDLVQAGEKLWGAVTALLNAIGEIKNLPHYSHRDYSEIIEYIAEEIKNPSLTLMFAAAERIHANFYHAFLRKNTFDELKKQVLTLISILKDYLQRILK